MPSRSARRRTIKQLRWADGLDAADRRASSRWHLTRWRAEARRRADDLGAPAVWALERSRRAVALAIDPTGELAAELSRVCAEAVAEAAGRHLVSGSRPAQDRARVRHVAARVPG